MKMTKQTSDGQLYAETMTVGELITKLQEYPAHWAVLPTWESIHTQIKHGGFRVTDCLGEKALEIDVDQWQ